MTLSEGSITPPVLPGRSLRTYTAVPVLVEALRTVRTVRERVYSCVYSCTVRRGPMRGPSHKRTKI